VLSASLALILSLVVVSGCSNDNYSEYQRVVCEVELVNDGAPLVAAFVEDGGDGFIGIDPVSGTSDDVFPFHSVPVMFRARPYSATTMVVPEDDVYSSFIITGYNLTWQPSPAVPAGLDLSQFDVRNAAYYLQVPVYEDAAAALMISDRALQDAIFNAQGATWPAGWSPGNDFTAIASLEFLGHASGTKNQVVIPAGVHVTFTYAVTTD
jgi:hypothetical protein